jgi:phospholipase D1/2
MAADPSVRPPAGRPRRPSRGPAWKKLALAALVLAALAATWRYSPLSEYLTVGRLRDWARVLRETPWAPIAVALAYTPASLVLFPRPLITLLAVIAFGAWVGFACAASGVLIAALSTYYAGRLLSFETVRRVLGDRVDDARLLLREHGIVSIFALNMVPVPPFSVQGVIAGSMRMSVWQYAIGTLLSVIPGLLAAALFGHEHPVCDRFFLAYRAALHGHLEPWPSGTRGMSLTRCARGSAPTTPRRTNVRPQFRALNAGSW